MNHKKLKSLTDWDWTTLVASWRYYEYRMTIASAMFPGDILERFFTGKYDEASQKRIARQFTEIDHHDGEVDWSKNEYIHDCDKQVWCKFYAFLKAYNTNGFKTVVLDGKDATTGKALHDEPKCFFCEYTKRWYPVDKYISAPSSECYCSGDFITEVKV